MVLYNVLAVAFGGALGAVSRYQFSLWVGQGTTFPVATLLVNIIGSFFFGALLYLLIEKAVLPDFWRLLLMVGFLGAFTTFSTFSYELFYLLKSGQVLYALILCFASVLFSFFALVSAYYLSKSIF